ncbi:alpha/beta fold hydrolase [Streptococcus sanguinis]|uniref:alpha/beta fold hydrolase n=1 Tax=Streptococcus sanguinis TaxID=1305 RepID=UPI001CBD3214|nr:alpha/beta hydrolase [Streptococcus sanguinis]MBZ2023202.1 alpha/beta hydrolase [Streptococcus sanguinis]MBZ2048032.1 alpha/beta hydrolase [Streptococcus sanguinis]MBZ2050491.1 alpha/beta hydrolase [Streptococcus sanguinis]MBZ2059469.1 alpha/beta hydrolase [Streptococcus sanguinis]MCC3176904.1 alpha/beta hydrolase fold family protein [Streptococcus sanguinis]
MLKRIFIFILKTITWLVGILALALLALFLYHRFQKAQESKLIEKPIGQLVEVEGKKLNVYTAGKGKKTLVFLSGLATNAPVLDFKALYSKLEDDYRIVVVERLGYGYSDDGNDDRSLDRQVEQTRKALKAAKISGPYVLVPHSIAGLETIHWANHYPEEVEAIIGLDMTMPHREVSDHMDLLFQTFQLGGMLGLARLPIFFDVNSSPAIKSGALNDQEKAIFKALFHRRSITQAVMNEVKDRKKNVETINKEPVPQIPTLIFAAVQQGGEAPKLEKEFVAQNAQAKLVTLEGSHYIHDDKPEEIAQQIKEFLK